VPVVAADLPVHREVCGEAALFFPRFSPQELADQVLRLEASPDLRKTFIESGRIRSREFSWEKHVDALLDLATSLARDSR
jgi:glycosyltransferase involved in cell wall biosynthesis